MREYIEVEYRNSRLGYYLPKEDLSVKPDDWVIVSVDRGYDIAKVITTSLSGEDLDAIFDSQTDPKLIRIANEEDLEKLENIILKEEKGAETFMLTLPKYEFEMKLIGTVYQFDGNKLTFFFTAPARIDFRMFVRELANVFKTRIELHQTTGREEAKRIGGFGMCGKAYCCSTFMKRFNQVTIKMAKDQNLSGNLSKISGPCGRLLCCLHFEEDYYLEQAKEFPDVGQGVIHNNQKMYVFRCDYYNKTISLTNNEELIESISLKEYEGLKKISKNYGRDQR
ncbi:MAG: regulatory iron-sulfur-containing complex subunit RicT [Candidatus Zophobacter franzmannii]|jgi:cell fate regulator YaaT (PSP1 superfamily)|nr:regulatory iron-sulfur-containing complex subunit RicT [Candidatus Zophobacter franzmannii]